ncbi:hypothetical protein B0H14DRAFT_2647723 [Mycena olivaceomarginata]|nr:hypothetical protein B0H14DRAFT_2647723 [Mycena olivaceomarginata]
MAACFRGDAVKEWEPAGIKECGFDQANCNLGRLKLSESRPSGYLALNKLNKGGFVGSGSRLNASSSSAYGLSLEEVFTPFHSIELHTAGSMGGIDGIDQEFHTVTFEDPRSKGMNNPNVNGPKGLAAFVWSKARVVFNFLASCFLGLSTNQIPIEDLNDGEGSLRGCFQVRIRDKKRLGGTGNSHSIRRRAHQSRAWSPAVTEVTTTPLVHPSIAEFRKGPKEATAGSADIGERRELELSGAAPAFRQAQGYWIDQKGIEFVPDCRPDESFAVVTPSKVYSDGCTGSRSGSEAVISSSCGGGGGCCCRGFQGIQQKYLGAESAPGAVALAARAPRASLWPHPEFRVYRLETETHLLHIENFWHSQSCCKGGVKFSFTLTLSLFAFLAELKGTVHARIWSIENLARVLVDGEPDCSITDLATWVRADIDHKSHEK